VRQSYSKPKVERFFESWCINLPGCNDGRSLQQRQSFSSR